MDLKSHIRAEKVKQIASRLGFDACGIAPASFLEKEARFLEEWLNKDQHGRMSYLANHFDLRTDPTKLVPGAKSVIVLALNYYPATKQESEAPKLSKYAYGRDYHKVIKKKLKHFLRALNDEFGDVHGRGFVDSAPVMEKAWAQKAGIGWMGKHTNILSKRVGSFFFLAVLIVDMELKADAPVTDHCGTCTACIDACPTHAIESPYYLNASKCISYYTIELKDDIIPPSEKGKFQDWMFGCDICQDVCPWNRFSQVTQVAEFEPKQELLNMTREEWYDLKEEQFNALFEGSAVKRTGYSGLIRNLNFIATSD